MKNSLKKMIVSALLVTCMVGGTAHAQGTQVDEKATEEQKICEFMLDSEMFLEGMNSVANKNADKVTNYMMYDGTTIEVEVRESEINGILITNTRTYETKESTRTVTDKYDLSYAGGVTGMKGNLCAQYTYSYAKIDSPNQMTTLFHGAQGYGEGLNSNYFKIVNTVPRWDTTPSYNASAEIRFNVSMKPTRLNTWVSSYYNHTCTFDKYGGAHMSWFE